MILFVKKKPIISKLLSFFIKTVEIKTSNNTKYYKDEMCEFFIF
jgi:hypothetical protein